MGAQSRCGFPAGVRKRARMAPDVQALFNFGYRQTDDANYLITAGLAGSNSNGGTRYLQKFREEVDAALIGFALHRRSSEGNLETIAKVARDGVLLGARMHLDGEGDAAGCFSKGNHGTRLSAPSNLSFSSMPLCLRLGSCSKNCRPHADTRRALFDGNLEVMGHTHGESCHADCGKIASGNFIAKLTQFAEMGPSGLGIVRVRWNRHETEYFQKLPARG